MEISFFLVRIFPSKSIGAKQEIEEAIGTLGQVAALVFHFVLDSGKLRMDLCLRSIPEISCRTSPAISALGYLSFSKYTHVRERPGGN
jgi:hypothetical protein